MAASVCVKVCVIGRKICVIGNYLHIMVIVGCFLEKTRPPSGSLLLDIIRLVSRSLRPRGCLLPVADLDDTPALLCDPAGVFLVDLVYLPRKFHRFKAGNVKDAVE